jgi:hypothetical protein
LAQPKYYSVPSLNKMYGTGKFWCDERDLSQISCQFFHTQNIRGPDEKEGNFPKLLATKLFHTQNVPKHGKVTARLVTVHTAWAAWAPAGFDMDPLPLASSLSDWASLTSEPSSSSDWPAPAGGASLAL